MNPGLKIRFEKGRFNFFTVKQKSPSTLIETDEKSKKQIIQFKKLKYYF